MRVNGGNGESALGGDLFGVESTLKRFKGEGDGATARIWRGRGSDSAARGAGQREWRRGS